MAGKGKKLRSWIYLYTALILAVIFASQTGAEVPDKQNLLSPVILGGSAPALEVDAIVRRSDL